MENLQDSFDAPIPVTLCGKEYELPLLNLDDLMAIGRGYQERAKQAVLKKLPLTATTDQRQAVSNDYDARETGVDELTQYLYTLPGAQSFIRRSLARAGIKGDDGADAKAWIARYAAAKGWREVAQLAARLSALFPPKKEEPKKANATDPNSQAGAQLENATGDGTSSPSSPSPDSAQAA